MHYSSCSPALHALKSGPDHVPLFMQTLVALSEMLLFGKHGWTVCPGILGAQKSGPACSGGQRTVEVEDNHEKNCETMYKCIYNYVH